ncbi:hypothetical protein [Sphingobacterium sp. SGR-19]|nr:hypothetical protein [Sphingobacterium sp. SGR-19]
MNKFLQKLTADDQFIMESHPTDVSADITEEEAMLRNFPAPSGG